ncbi:hypothetical protein LTR09_005853 [Extremus antarcticus]|uniref:ASST-domain-containing protein n=1 Tax=Extremus antarcticus TaxID=702011 RepID=A0AAJ0DFS8_9PEZI|nr:hypothetical protein LTR09_005853 [Extremus antarcticus]
MPWTLPLGAINALAQFNPRYIPSDNHFQYTTDSYSELWPWRSYRTSPHMPPHMNITRYDDNLADGYIFLTPYDDKVKDGVHEEGTGFVMTTEGDLVFTPPSSFDGFCEDWLSGMTDFRKQEYRGKKYLTYWNGCNTHGAHWGHRWGRVTFIDQDYNNFTINPDLKINSLDDANEGQIDVHEHHMTDDDTMVVSSYNNTPYDLSPLGGPRDSWVVDSCFFEVDIATEEVLFEWCALNHVPLKNSRLMSHNPHGTKNNPYDWFHINAVQKIGKNYLISSRHHFAAYMISGEDGSVLWRLDGEDGGDFGSIPANFRLQHHVRAQNISDDGLTITMFNNHGRRPTLALGFWLPLPPDPKNPPVLVRRLEVRDDPVHAATQGSFQMDIGKGHAFVGYGKVPLAREFGPVKPGEVNAKLLWEGRFGYNGAAMSYRGYKMPWHATPKDWDPVILVEKTRLQRKGYLKVFVSWNGATDVGAYAVFAGDDEASMQSVGVVKKKGFETVFHVENATCVQLGAIRDGKIIRGSNLACVNPDDAFHSEIEDASTEQDQLENFDLQAGAEDKHNATMMSEVDELQAEKEQLEAEKHQLEAETEKLEAETKKLEAETDELQAHMNELEDELQAGAWTSYRLFAEVACGVVAIVAVTWAYILWRERRQANFQEDKYEPSSFGLGGFGLRVKKQRTPSIWVHHASVDEAQMKGVGDEDDDDGPGSGATTSRTPFLRQVTDR